MCLSPGDERLTRWLASLEARHLADFRVAEVTRALRALSSAYVHRRQTLTAGAALNSGFVFQQSFDPDLVETFLLPPSQYRAPRFDVFVPKTLQATITMGALTPRRLREAIGRLMGVDQVMTEADPSSRRAYEERAAKSKAAAEDRNEEAPQREVA